MKRMMTIGLVLSAAAAYSQNYWVVETAATGPSIVKVYSADHKLMSEQKLDRRIDITKKRERKMLNKIAKQRSELLWSKR